MAALMHGMSGHYIHPEATSVQPLATQLLQNASTPTSQIAHQYGNDSIDVALMGCFDHYDTLACTRNSMMAVLVLLTGTLCVLKLCRLHCRRYPTHHQYAIFYSATLECILCSVHWIVGRYAQLEFLVQWLKLVELLVVSHLYWTIVSRVHGKISVTNGVILPLYIVALLYFSVVAVLGCIFTQDSWVECFQPYWLALSSVELVLVQLFTIAAVYIAKRLNEISTLDSVRREQKRDLWLLVVFFQLSAVCSFIYDLTLKILSDKEGGCSGVFQHTQQIYTPVYGSLMVIKFLLPIWGMLFVFHPIDNTSDSHDILAQSDDGHHTSIFRPSYNRSHYRPITYAGTGDFNATPPELDQSPFSGGSSSTGTTPIFGPRQLNGRRISELQSSLENDQSVDISDRRLML